MSQFAGALSSVLMTIPLIAVPCLAVFGLPSLGPATAEAETGDPVRLADAGDLGSPSPAPAAAPAAFTPIVDATGSGSGAVPQPIGGGGAGGQSRLAETSDRRAAAANRAVGLEEPPARTAPTEPPAAKAAAEPPATPFAAATPSAAVENQPPAAAAATPGPTGSLEAAVEKLDALGVRDFRLIESEVPGEFYCSCALREGQVTRRFEAEAASRAAAVADLLAQVEACRGVR